MALDRTWYNTLVDDSGAGTDGSIIDKADMDAILDAVDLQFVNGTWTPVLAFGGASVGITYGTQSARTTKTDRGVLIEISIGLTSKGSSTGAATITGLPYAAAMNPVSVLDASTMTSVTGMCFAIVISSTLHLFQSPRTALDNTNFTNTSFLQFGLNYSV